MPKSKRYKGDHEDDGICLKCKNDKTQICVMCIGYHHDNPEDNWEPVCKPTIAEKLAPKPVYVVWANDSLMAIVIGDKEKAERIMNRLKENHITKMLEWRHFKDRNDYDECITWRLNDDVPLLEE